jgi:hypothetical protein
MSPTLSRGRKRMTIAVSAGMKRIKVSRWLSTNSMLEYSAYKDLATGSRGDPAAGL